MQSFGSQTFASRARDAPPRPHDRIPDTRRTLTRCVPPSSLPKRFHSEDAAEAMDNMHNAELYGKVLRCNYAQPRAIKGGNQGWSMQPVWADADKYKEDVEEAKKEEGGGMAAAEKENEDVDWD